MDDPIMLLKAAIASSEEGMLIIDAERLKGVYPDNMVVTMELLDTHIVLRLERKEDYDME